MNFNEGLRKVFTMTMGKIMLGLSNQVVKVEIVTFG